MILAPISDPRLRSAVRRAALPEEDVFHSPEGVREALRLGFPRLLVYRPEEGAWRRKSPWSAGGGVPTLVVADSTLKSWEAAWHSDGLAVSRIDDSALRLRSLMRQAGLKGLWVEEFFGELTRVLGRGLPPSLRGFGRRVMEHPTRYVSLGDLGPMAELTPGALKGRFRRRDLPSPAVYLRWFRLAAARHVLGSPQVRTLEASHRLGFTSDGNFCRWVQATSGLAPTALRDPGSRAAFLVRMVETCFPEGSLERWEGLDEVFLRDVA